MGDRRFGIVLLVAILVAAGAGFGVYRMLQQAQADARGPTGSVVVAAADFPEGHILTKQDTKITVMPRAAVPPGSYANPDSVIGRVTRIPVFTGEALVPGRLAPVGAGAGLEVKIAPGKRAMAVKIDEVAGLSGLIQPNSRVDVLVTVREENAGAQQRAKLFMSNMRVLSVGTQMERGPDGRPMNATTAALEVTPTEAEQLAIAANQGRIQLVLRGYGDPDTVATKGASINDMMRKLDIAPAPKPSAAEPRTRIIYVPTKPAPAPAAPVTPAPVPAPQPKRPDSAVVQVYRGSAATQQKIEKKDTIKPPRFL
jgi:pilus assembly protein CpaB